MKEKIADRLLSVKSIVTIILTVGFVALCFMGKLDQNFMMIFTVIISFYFGTQAQKVSDTSASKILEASEIDQLQGTGSGNVFITLPQADSEKIAEWLHNSGATVSAGDEEAEEGGHN